jgi:hypothetical protein
MILHCLWKMIRNYFKYWFKGWGCSSVMEHLSNKFEEVGSISSIIRKENQMRKRQNTQRPNYSYMNCTSR